MTPYMYRTTIFCGAMIAIALSGPGIDALASVFATAPSPAYRVHVTAVVDGDTLAIDPPTYQSPNYLTGLKFRIRVRGIDTPEKAPRAQCASEADRAKRASALTAQLVKASADVVTVNAIEHDKYGGRLVANVVLKDGTLLSNRLIAAGLARPYNGGTKTSWCML